MGRLVRDLRYGFRVLARNPGFAAVAAVVLGLGIGANSAIFSVVNSVLLRPLPFPSANQLVRVWHVPPAKSFPGTKIFDVSPANYLDWQRQNHVFQAMAIQGYKSRNLTGLAQPETVVAARVSASFFSVLGARPMLGRAFGPEEDRAGSPNLVILKYSFWKSHLAGNPNLVGHQLQLDGQAYTIAGVMGPAFRIPDDVDLWVPLGWTDEDRAVRNNHNYVVIARLKSHVEVKQAQAEMNTISDRLQARYPADDAGWGALVLPLQEDIVGDARPALLVLLGAVAFVLLIACANVANLLLAKTLGRRKEVAIRQALGASRASLLGQVLSETCLLALAGGLLGLVLAYFGVSLIVTFVTKDLPRAAEIGVDGWVLGFALAISLLAGMLAGLLPAWRLTQTNVNEALKSGLGKTDADTGGNRTRSGLVACEVALSLVLLVGAGLMVRTVRALGNVNPGFDARNVLTMQIAIPQAKYPQRPQQSAFFDKVLERVRALPGVLAAGTIDALPLSGGSTQPVAIEGRPVLALADQPEVGVRNTSPSYLSAMRIPLLAGRDFNDGDAAGTQAVILVSQFMAAQFWPGENPIGKRLTLSFTPDKLRTVVGVVANVRNQGLAALRPQAMIYVPMDQDPWTWLSLVVRTAGPPSSAITAVADAVHQVDPDQPVLEVRTMESLVADSLFEQRFDFWLLGAFAALALLLAAVGIYSVLAYAVRRRVREIGLRVALGAQPGDVVQMIVSEGMKPTLIGLGAGFAGALALGRVMASLIFGVGAADPATFVAVSVLLAAVALAACVLPAYRATRVAPSEALREE